MKKQSKLGFSLIELSIVILVIGILVIGITQGSRIMSESNLKSARNLTNGSPVSSIPNLAMWLESTSENSFSSTEQNNNSQISIWNDVNTQSSTQNNATQENTSAKPLLISKAINNLPAVRFDGISSFLSFNGNSIVNKDYTIFIVEQRRASGNNPLVATSSSILSANTALQTGYTSGGTFFNFDNWAMPNVGAAVPQYSSLTPKIYSFTFRTSFGKSIYLNGNNILAQATDSNAKTPLSEYRSPAIGKLNNSSFYNGDIGEIIIFSRNLTNTERNSIEKYLSQKWKIAVS